jgi:Tol biopolymer transport system component
MKRIALVGVVAACGDVKSKQVDAMIDTRVVDAAETPPRCNPGAAFSTPTAVAELNTAMSDEAAWLTADEKTLYFSSTRTGTLGGYDIFTATRADTSSAWTNIMPVAGVNSSGTQRFPVLTEDGLAMLALIGTAPNYQIGIAMRMDSASAFSTLADAPTINSTNNDEGDYLAPGAVYFATDRDGNYEIYRAPRTNTQLGTPLPISGNQVNTSGGESNPVVSPDELTLYFSSNRAGGVGGYDIWMAKRASLADGFGMPENLQALNSTDIDAPTWVSADGCVIYLLRGQVGAYDIYVARRGT